MFFMWWLFTLAIFVCTIYSLRATKEVGGIPFLHQECLVSTPISFWTRLISIILWVGSFLFLILACVTSVVGDGPLCNLVRKNIQTSLPLQSSRLVSFVVDRSGSMGEIMPGQEEYSKMYLVQKELDKCIRDLDEKDPSNLISLTGFSRVAKCIVPFSRDRTFLFSALSTIIPEKKPSLNGTAIGYAIFKNIRLILACKAFATQTGQKDAFAGRSMIVITDGIEEPHPADHDHPFRSMRVLQALANASQANVAVYYINIDRNTYKLLRVEERDALSSAVSKTGGKYFEVTQGFSLNQILEEIVLHETNVVSLPANSGLTLGYWLIICALLTISLSRLFETGIMRVMR